MSYAVKQIRTLMGKAIHTYGMIQDGEHIMVAVSGGKDSLTLLWELRKRLKRVPIEYHLTAVHVNPGFNSESAFRMEAFFKTHGFPYKVIRSDVGLKAHSQENRENPCFLCARLRRKLLFETAAELGCNKIAFAHHKDDIIETFFINLFYGASISTMLPVQTFFRGNIVIIRPFFMVDEFLIERYVREMHWSPIDLGCPTASAIGKNGKGHKRQEIRHMLRDLYRSNKKVKGNIFHAIHNVRQDYLPKAPSKAKRHPISMTMESAH